MLPNVAFPELFAGLTGLWGNIFIISKILKDTPCSPVINLHRQTTWSKVFDIRVLLTRCMITLMFLCQPGALTPGADS